MCLCACLDSHASPEHTTSMRAAHGQGMVALALGIGPLLVLIFGILTYINIGLFFFKKKSNGPISRNWFKTGLFGLSLSLMSLASPALSHLWGHLIGYASPSTSTWQSPSEAEKQKTLPKLKQTSHRSMCHSYRYSRQQNNVTAEEAFPVPTGLGMTWKEAADNIDSKHMCVIERELIKKKKLNSLVLLVGNTLVRRLVGSYRHVSLLLRL